jgi:flagellar basal body rod protein FlgB
MKCSHCGSKTPKLVKVKEHNGTVTIDGYSVSVEQQIYQCKNKSCNYAFNVNTTLKALDV